MAKFNSKIIFKGDREPFYVAKNSAEVVNKRWLDKNVSNDTHITVGKKTFLKGDIRSISIENDSLYGDEMSSNKNYEEEEFQKRKEFLAYSPEKKAGLFEYFKTFFRGMAGIDPSEEQLEQARLIQLNFFRNNPKRTLCDPLLFKEIIPKRNFMNIWEDGVVRFIENAVQRDIYLSLKK